MLKRAHIVDGCAFSVNEFWQRGLFPIVFFALVSRRNATYSYFGRIPERRCVKKKARFIKYRSNIWHNLFKNKACQKALNLWNRKCNLAPTKRKTVITHRPDDGYYEFSAFFRGCAKIISVSHVYWQDVSRWCTLVPRLCRYTTGTTHFDVCSHLCYVAFGVDYS